MERLVAELRERTALVALGGGETRWFLGATLVTIALRLSYRPFNKD